jgi:hypothetical protein
MATSIHGRASSEGYEMALSLCIAGFSGFRRVTQTSPPNTVSAGLVHTISIPQFKPFADIMNNAEGIYEPAACRLTFSLQFKAKVTSCQRRGEGS